MAKKTVITRVMDVESNESIIEFPQNRALLVEQLTSTPPPKADIVSGLRTMDDVFAHFKPSAKIEFEDVDGQTKKETLQFREIRDFDKDRLKKNAGFLKQLDLLKENYEKMEHQLKTNKVLRDAVSNPESRKALIMSMQSLLKELQDNK